MRKRKNYLFLFIAIAMSVSLAIPGLTSAAEKNNPGVFDGGTAKKVVNIGAAFGEGVLIRHITGHASTEGRAHAQGALLGSVFGLADSVFDCVAETKCTAKQFATDAFISGLTGGGLGYAVSTIGGESPLIWSGVVEATWEAMDEFGINAVYEK